MTTNLPTQIMIDDGLMEYDISPPDQFWSVSRTSANQQNTGRSFVIAPVERKQEIVSFFPKLAAPVDTFTDSQFLDQSYTYGMLHCTLSFFMP